VQPRFVNEIPIGEDEEERRERIPFAISLKEIKILNKGIHFTIFGASHVNLMTNFVYEESVRGNNFRKRRISHSLRQTARQF